MDRKGSDGKKMVNCHCKIIFIDVLFFLYNRPRTPKIIVTDKTLINQIENMKTVTIF